MECRIELEYAIGERVAPAEIIEEPAVDLGITQSNLLNASRRSGEIGNIDDKIVYIAKLFNEEMHILVRSDVNDIHELQDKPVNFGAEGSGTEITSTPFGDRIARICAMPAGLVR